LIVNGSSLAGPGQTISVDGSAVELGNLALFGGAGDDALTGGASADRLHGAGGQDDLTGGGGADIFQYRAAAESISDAPDGIDDFEPGLDLVDLRLIDANTLVEGDQAFSWIGAEAFGGDGAASAGQLRAYRDGATWFVEGDTDGDGIADLVIVLTLPFDAELSHGDFLL